MVIYSPTYLSIRWRDADLIDGIRKPRLTGADMCVIGGNVIFARLLIINSKGAVCFCHSRMQSVMLRKQLISMVFYENSLRMGPIER